ncbi:hypothetical protein [Mucilaginibacter polytrichastri]|uniref:hypothetical protein n=1 Tax=Mucilaginibacter polytrichastri TaxID=1302689 RepID=UPI0008DFC531|nr:hypothetical protein [Mucilaginibacter polytrichastri]SFS91845.1 hypothetical protein SAMN04487890_106129 [Mucilaginibacter polytrichastri]
MTDSISTYDQWKANRPLVIGSLIYTIVIFVILFYTIYAYFNMQHINGRVASVDVDRQKHTYLTLKLTGDKRIYYQVYGKRFYDPAIENLHKNDSITLYTFNTPEKKHAAISSSGDQSSFLYYPVFNINKQSAGILDVFYYYIYDNLILSLIVAFSWVLILYNGFYIFIQAGWAIKIPIIIWTLIMAWIMI